MRETLVVLTREVPDDAAALAALTAAGYKVRVVPCIRTRLLPVSPRRGRALVRCDALAFTSRRAVAAVGQAADAVRTSRALLFAVGPSTAGAVERAFGRRVAAVPERHDSVGLAGEILRFLKPGSRRTVVHPRGSLGLPDLATRLRSAGHRVREPVVYETTVLPAASLGWTGLTVVVLASPSAVDGFLEGNAPGDADRIYVALGDTIARRLAQRGATAVVISEGLRPEALVETLRMVGIMGETES